MITSFQALECIKNTVTDLKAVGVIFSVLEKSFSYKAKLILKELMAKLRAPSQGTALDLYLWIGWSLLNAARKIVFYFFDVYKDIIAIQVILDL